MILNQTLQEKFSHLEVSVLKLSEAQKDNETKRIDSEFFKKTDLRIKNKLSVIQSKYLFSLVSSNSRYSQPTYDKQSSLKIINSQYIRNEFIDYENAKCGYGAIVPKEAVLINSTGVGTLGRVNINLLDIDFSIDSHINVLIVKDKNELNPCYLMIFLQTKYGQSQINRYCSGTSGQIEIYPRDFDNFLIPLLPMSFQLEIEKIVKDSHLALEQSKALYKEAETLLYVELGLDPANPLQSILESKPNKNTNFRITTLKESFLKTGRLDSEYYQIKYDKIESFIQSYQGGFSHLELIEIKDSNFTPNPKENYRYIELANIGANGNISAPLEELGEFLPTRARRIVKDGDLIISSIEGSLSSCALITKEFNNCIVSTGFYVLKSRSINSETLLVLFKSKVFQDYLKKFPSGTILSAISKEELQNILIPKIDSKIQKSIASYIQKSFALRAEAKNLLNEAKAKVEEAIKNGGGGANSALFMSIKLEIFRIYFPQIKAKLKESKLHYRLGQWLLLEELLFSKDSQKSCCLASDNVQSLSSKESIQLNRDTSLSTKVQTTNYTIATLKQTLGASGRLDSEYYQVKYEKNEAMIKSKPYVRLKDIVEIKKSIEPGSEAYRESGIPFIRVSNLSPFGVSQSEVFLDSKDFKKGELESLYPKKNTILLSKDGSVGISYCVENDLECVTSGAILHLTIKNQALILPQYLSLVLHSLPTKLQAQRDSGGSIIAHWKISEIANLLIPLLDKSIQQKIESKITQSFALRAKSKNLLESAKIKVENKIRESF